jgi:AAA domain
MEKCDPGDNQNSEQERILEILDYWHKIEFFVPFDLEKMVDDSLGWQVIWLHKDDLKNEASAFRSHRIPEDHVVTGFALYLGIFDKSVASAVLEPFLKTQPNATDEYEDAERAEIEGSSCFAKINLDQYGQPSFDRVSISTFPWALGQVKRRGLSSLAFCEFETAKSDLQERLHNFSANRSRPDNTAGPEEKRMPLRNSEVMALHSLFCEWAGFEPASELRIGALKALAKKRKPDKAVEFNEEDPDELFRQRLSETNDEEEEETEEPELDILNSFFIEDIERVSQWVQLNRIPVPLKQYLSAIAKETRVDLYSETGRQHICDTLLPKNLNRGHWFNKPEESMSLMQQFAINTTFEVLKERGLFSVNGPPGTGKTTLLREIFAENIVRRAARLASLNGAGDAFSPKKVRVCFGDGSSSSIARLKPDIAGFEMVVASSNNTAVENISRDLPKRSSLKEPWLSSRYIQSVAHKIAAQKENGSCKKLPEDEVPWGLVSCVLGKNHNRRWFKERFAFLEIKPDEKPTWSGDSKPENIWEWARNFKGPSFIDAACNFRDARANVEKTIADLNRIAQLQLGGNEKAIEAKKDAVSAAKANCGKARKQVIDAEKSIDDSVAELKRLKEQERLIDRTCPVWWKRLLGTPEAKFHKNAVSINASAQLHALEEQRKIQVHLKCFLNPELSAAQIAVTQAENALAKQASELAELDQLRDRFGELSFPQSPGDVELDSIQEKGIWTHPDLDRSRSRLFAAALQIHESWLAESMNKHGFGANIFTINKLLSNQRLENPEQSLLIWQSLFMIVPVISTTFASLARQFRDLKPDSIGWLFVDEAGQAVPQAAVGGLWRAKRVIVVGDPLQIEPVFTLPSRLIAALSDQASFADKEDYAPNKSSAQYLADRANRFGVMLAGEGRDSLWIGSPLRVHRRCIDPMYSVSNRIAYQNKMIFGLKQRSQPNGPPIHFDSSWIDICGKVLRKQEVPEQTRFVVDLLTHLFNSSEDPLGIYVISPFREVKNAIKNELISRVGAKAPMGVKLKEWCNERIGTVHTFQGKEEDTVLLVLGADLEHSGAAQWAASKPNLLNVAITRAKRRLFVIGERSLWESLPYFEAAAQELKIRTPDEILRSLKVSV